LAIKHAREAFDNGPWRKMSAYDRGRLISKLADLIEQHTDEIAELEAQDNGKPFHIAKFVDIALAIKTYRYYAGWADKIQGSTIPIGSNHFCYTREEPVGVCA
jgi:aldehyde dehydrogenase (NAD+)